MMNTYTSMMGSKIITKRPYSAGISKDYSGSLLYISKIYCKDPYAALRIAYAELIEDVVRCKDCVIIVNLIMYLLFKYAYPKGSEYGKFTIHYTMKTGSGIVTYAIGRAITFRLGGVNQPVRDIVDEYVRVKAEAYGDAVLTSIFIRIYYDENLSNVEMNISNHQIARLIAESMVSDEVYDRIAARKIENRKPKYLKHITRLKPNCKERRSFIVADTETVLVESDTDQIDKVHMPYAVGFLVVEPGEAPSKEKVGRIETYFSEDYLYDTFRKRSYKMLTEFIDRLAHVVRKDPSIHTIYFHNLSRFDGYLFLKFFASGAGKYTFKPLIKDHQIYELVIYNGRKLLLRLRDSLKLLPRRLDDLAQNLCPQLGRKGVIEHHNVNESNLSHHRDELLEYMKQDILLLGGVMHRAQEIYYDLFQIDIVKKRTLSSLALDIFRTLYYDQNQWPIYIPNRNEDTFIRRGYYGGHSDTYIPYGKELYYYDVNSLYPYVMKNYPMPGGEPVWIDKCEEMDLDSLFGFFEAFVVAPADMKRPFLPYRTSKKSLTFPTGEFVGVYYSEELKYAKSIGYQVIPLCGYIFQKITPFGDFVTTLSEKQDQSQE